MCTLRFGIGSGVTKNFHLAASRDEPCFGGLNSVNGSRVAKQCSWRFFRARRAGSHKHDAHRNAPYSRHPLVSARFARGGVTHPRARREARGVPPRTGALPSAVGASQADSPVGPGVRITCDMTSHDKVRRESLRCAEALFTRRDARTNARGDARARPVSAPAHRRFAKALR
jgi:hypothetical protein